jgi:hypothetical protein
VWYLTTNDPITAGVTSISVAQMTLTITTSSISDMTTPSRAMATAASYAAMRTLLSTDTTSDTRTPTDATVSLAKLTAPVTAALFMPQYIPLAGIVSVDATQTVRDAGGSALAIDFADYTITGKTLTVSFVGSGSATSGQTLTVRLIDVTNSNATAATLTISSATPAAATPATVTTPGTARLYRVEIAVSGSTTAHVGTLLNASLRLTWS